MFIAMRESEILSAVYLFAHRGFSLPTKFVSMKNRSYRITFTCEISFYLFRPFRRHFNHRGLGRNLIVLPTYFSNH